MQDDATRGALAPSEAGGDATPVPTMRSATDRKRSGDQVPVDLTAVVLSVRHDQPVALVTRCSDSAKEPAYRLPTARFCPLEQPSLEAAVRKAVLGVTDRHLGYVEQLLTDYCQADVASDAVAPERSRLSVSYLALARAEAEPLAKQANWLNCYDLLPWEDFRNGRPGIIEAAVLPALRQWARSGASDEETTERQERLRIAFAAGGSSWDDQRVIDRFDLIQESDIAAVADVDTIPVAHKRLVAAGLGRLRAKIRYRPVVFELLPAEFTLFELQRTVEAALGPTLHKQNFRRLVEGTGLVEPTGDVRTNTGGRPAKTFRFRREVLLERPAPGVHVRSGRAA